MNDKTTRALVVLFAGSSDLGFVLSRCAGFVGRVGAIFDVVVVGSGVESLPDVGAKQLFLLDADEYAAPSQVADGLVSLITRLGANLVVGASSVAAQQVMPMVAQQLDGAMVSNVVGCSTTSDRLLFECEQYAGGVTATMAIAVSLKVVTIRPELFEPVVPAGTASARSLCRVELPGSKGDRWKVIERRRRPESGPTLREAQVVVAAGRGCGSASVVDQLVQLAQKLGGAAGASRPVVDQGWMDHERQIGQTGCQVAPQLYIAVGISGALQHVSGMRGAKTVVAINKDPEAPIFKMADIGFVGDAASALKELTALLEIRE